MEGRLFYRLVGIVLCLMVLATSDAFAQPTLATYYGWELAGNPTASGDVFDPMGYTAAHKYLPFGTVVLVCYDGCVTVVINDRGPYGSAEYDLTLGAAMAIGLDDEGIGPVDATIQY